jgi:hypothetical protein
VSSPAKCICPGNKVPFYCPIHGRVENPNWSELKLRRPVERLLMTRSSHCLAVVDPAPINTDVCMLETRIPFRTERLLRSKS